MTKAKPFDIPKREVWEAFKKVKANQGAAGVDGQTIADFEIDLANNLYKLWNRLSSGSYLPQAVRRVDIPKAGSGTRPLGIPTVADRIAQEVVRRYLEPRLDPLFHADSYDYRPGRSAIDAVRSARQRCWRYNWVLDLDIKAFFDTIPHKLLLKAWRAHTDCRWGMLFVESWFEAPGQRGKGWRGAPGGRNPQGTLSHSPVRLPRIYFPAEVYGLAQRNIWRLVLARGVPRSTQGNASGSPAMGSPEPDRHGPS